MLVVLLAVCNVDEEEQKSATSYFVILRVVRFVIEHIVCYVDREEQNSATSCYVVCEFYALSSNELKELFSI